MFHPKMGLRYESYIYIKTEKNQIHYSITSK